MRNENLGIPILSSLAIHILMILIASVILQSNHTRRHDFLPIGLVDLPPPENPPPAKILQAPPAIRKPVPPRPKVEISKATKLPAKQESKPLAKVEIPKPEPPAPLPAPAKKIDIPKPESAAPLPAPPSEDPAAPARAAAPPSFSPGSRVEGEGGGSEAGAGNLFHEGDIGVIQGAGTAGGGGGTAPSGLGRGSGAPGFPAQAGPIKTNRQAKPTQTVRASYPPMALRAGLESDVSLKIEVDTQGKVINAEITKSGGAGFDEEALKAVKQARFEPAQKDGKNVAAEFTYVYRFRLRK